MAEEVTGITSASGARADSSVCISFFSLPTSECYVCPRTTSTYPPTQVPNASVVSGREVGWGDKTDGPPCAAQFREQWADQVGAFVEATTFSIEASR